MIYYVCKYTPIELFRGFGEECSVLEEMPENFEQSDQIAHANLCGFGKSVIQAVLEGKVEQLVLVNCCDSMRRVYDIVESTGKCKFLYMLDLPHDDKRIVLWDLYNEPGGSGGYRYGERSLPLLQKIFTWGRTVNPSQPLSAGVWDMSLTNLNKFQLENSDVITYHTYEGVNSHQQLIDTYLHFDNSFPLDTMDRKGGNK